MSIMPHSQALMSETLEKPLTWEEWILQLPIGRFLEPERKPKVEKSEKPKFGEKRK